MCFLLVFFARLWGYFWIFNPIILRFMSHLQVFISVFIIQPVAWKLLLDNGIWLEIEV